MNEVKNLKKSAPRPLIFPDLDSIGQREARALLTVKFSKHDLSQINDLSALAQAGHLTEEQATMLEGYVRLGNVLTMLHSRARMVLKRNASARQRRKSA